MTKMLPIEQNCSIGQSTYNLNCFIIEIVINMLVVKFSEKAAQTFLFTTPPIL